MWGKQREAKAGKSSEKDDKTSEILAHLPPSPEVQAAPAAGFTAAEAPGANPDTQLAPTPAQANGAAAQPAPALDEKTPQYWRGKLATANFGAAVALFMHSPAHKHLTLAGLEQCLVPPLRLNQFMMAEAKQPNGQAVPAGLVLWARVSAEVDARLSAAPGYPIRLHPNEWQSGEVYWIVDAVGEAKAVQQCVETLTKTAFREKQFKMLKAQTR